MTRRGEDGSLTQVKPHVFKRLWDFGQGDCVAPTRLLCRRAVGRDGAFTVRYSHSGRYLAVAACDGEHHFPIQIYDMDAEEGCAVLKGPELSGHVSIVYDLNWSEDDRFLVSASADSTIRTLLTTFWLHNKDHIELLNFWIAFWDQIEFRKFRRFFLSKCLQNS